MNSAFMHYSRTKSQQVRLKKRKKAETQEKLNVDAEAEYKHTLKKKKNQFLSFNMYKEVASLAKLFHLSEIF